MDLDSFFVSVERLQNSQFVGKPLLIGGTGDRGVVACCSYEARKFGVHAAMPVRLALRLCPDAIVVKGDHERYTHYSEVVTEIIKEAVPLYEKTSIDEFYIDMTGMDRFYGCYDYTHELRGKIMKETGLPISFGLSVNKTVSKVATGQAKPNGEIKVDNGTERPFLAPLSIQKIPMVGDKTFRLLKSMGVEKVKTVQEMPVELMERLLGDNGTMIWKKANGIDNSPVIAYSERKSISTEETFGQDTMDVSALKNILVSMAEKVGFQLRSQKKLTSCITVKVRYSNFDTHTMQARIAYTSCDHVLIPKIKELFDKLFSKRMMVRLIGVRVSHLVGGNYQINMFDDTEEMMNLYQAIDRMKTRYGEGKIVRAIGLNRLRHNVNLFQK